MLTDLSFLSPGQPWPPRVEKSRLDRYNDNRKLFIGAHPDVFGDWVRLLRADQRAALEMVINLPKRLSTLWADLLVGEPPRFNCGDDQSPEQVAINRLVTDNMLPVMAYEVSLDVSRYGDGVYQVYLDQGRSVIEGLPPNIWFPVLSPDNLRAVQAHVLAWTFKRHEPRWNDATNTQTYLRAAVHYKGRIEHRLFSVTQGGTIDRELDITSQFPERKPVEATGVDDFLVVPVAGLRTTDSFYGQDDYTDIVTIVQELEVRLAQISRILDKHSDPSMHGPGDAVVVDPQTGETTVPGGGSYYKVEEGETPPGYLVWDGKLDAAFTEIEKLYEAFYITSETTAAAFGDIKTGQIASGAALRRLMQAPLAKVNRVRLRMEPALKSVLSLAAELEAANGIGTPALTGISVTWRDGLPEDPAEVAAVEATLKGSGLTSRYSSIKRIWGGTEKDVQDELDRIDQDEAQQAATASSAIPPIMLKQRVVAEGM